MKLIINISDDTELRKQLQELIDGQYRAMVREEVQLAVKAEAKRLVENTMNDKLLKAVETGAHNAAIRYFGTQYWGSAENTGAQKVIGELVARTLSRYNLEDMVRNGVKNYMDQVVKRI